MYLTSEHHMHQEVGHVQAVERFLKIGDDSDDDYAVAKYDGGQAAL